MILVVSVVYAYISRVSFFDDRQVYGGRVLIFSVLWKYMMLYMYMYLSLSHSERKECCHSICWYRPGLHALFCVMD